MSQKDLHNEEQINENVEQENVQQDATNLHEEQVNSSDNTEETDKVADPLAELQAKYNELNDSHLRLMAEFDNYRKRTLREKSELIKNGGENALTQLLPVVDDFERALQNVRKADNVEAVAEGVELIYNKFIAYLTSQGVKAMATAGQSFDADIYEAIATIPAPTEDMKGKVIDCVQTGYMLNEKVIRHAKVVVGE